MLTVILATILTQTSGTDWTPIFDGETLDGWTAKINGYEFGYNVDNTFRVVDGVIRVSYDDYGGEFDNRFGHLFYKAPYESYDLRWEYRFFGDQLPDAPGWAFRNSGIMFHCQDPKTMGKTQAFPVCLEFQLLGGNGEDDRSTANLATPGTHVIFNDSLDTRHVIGSNAKTYHGNDWVSAELEVRKDGTILHKINGETVMEYKGAQLDSADANAKPLIEAADGEVRVNSGWISLQSESHPCEFRNIEIRVSN